MQSLARQCPGVTWAAGGWRGSMCLRATPQAGWAAPWKRLLPPQNSTHLAPTVCKLFSIPLFWILSTHVHTHTYTVWRANSDEVNSTTILQAREESDNPNTTGQRREAAESARALPDGREMPPWMPAALPDCPGTSSTQSQPPLPPGQPRRLGS